MTRTHTHTRRASIVAAAGLATAIVLTGGTSASAGTVLAPSTPQASRISLIDLVDDFLYCNAAEEAALDQMYPSGFVFFDCMRGGAPGSNG